MNIIDMANLVLEQVGRQTIARDLGLQEERTCLWINKAIRQVIDSSLNITKIKDPKDIKTDGFSRIASLIITDKIAAEKNVLEQFYNEDRPNYSVKLRQELEDLTFKSGLITEGSYLSTSSMSIIYRKAASATVELAIVAGRTYLLTEAATTTYAPGTPLNNLQAFYASIGSTGMAGDIFTAKESSSALSYTSLLTGKYDVFASCYFDQEIVVIPNETATYTILTGSLQKITAGITTYVYYDKVRAETLEKKLWCGIEKKVINQVRITEVDDLPKNTNDPFLKILGTSLPGFIWSNYFTVYDVFNTLTHINLTYIRRPAVVKLPTLEDPTFCDCDLPEATHAQVVDLATQLILNQQPKQQQQ